ncbi:MAG: TIGR03936 family radical SAM-associated protein [Candidatus Eisenbacteria bacterium]|nr:TIGR03936 family radical SAM-associated protein [Candidatus Eisenbacteria bacterium]
MNFVKSGAVRSLLPLVAKPGRYAGPLTSANPGRFATARIRVAVLHPDHFETGLTHEVTRASFRAIESISGVAADMVFLPWSDLDDRLSAHHAAPWGIESGAPLDAFDLLLFTPATALQYVHLPRLLARAGIRPDWQRRAEAGDGGTVPLVAAIGPLMANPLPLADLVDCVFLGEPEGGLPQVARALVSLCAEGAGSMNSVTRREERLAAIESLPGVARTDRDFSAIAPALASESMLALTDPLILPLVEASGEGLRLAIRVGDCGETFRHVWRPAASAWVRSADEALASVDRVLKETGLERIDLVGDAPRLHPALQPLVESINRRFPGVRIGLDDFGLSEPRPALAREILRGKRGPVVMSPWAATERLRATLGLSGTNDMLVEAAATALRGGAIPITFRFGIGWPGETDADRAGIVQLMRRVRSEAVGAQPTRFVIELLPFIPQPGSTLSGAMPFGGLDLARVAGELTASLEAIGPCQVRTPPADLVAIEAYLTNGGREVGAALIRAAEAGATTPDPIHPWQGEPWVTAFPAIFENGGTVSSAATPGMSFALAPPVVMTDTPDRRESSTGDAPTIATSDDPAGYGRKSRRKGPVSARPASRYRLRFAKTALLTTTSHLDVGRMFERALRRLERSRMAWHNKSVKLSFGPPLPLGWTSEDEYVDLQFADDVPESMPAAIGEVLNDGLLFLEVSPIRSSVESLAHAIDRAHYMIDFGPEFLESSAGRDHADWQRRLTDGVARIKLAREILVRKKPEDEIPQVDVRPGVLAALLSPGEGPVSQLHLHLTLGVPGSVRPEALLPHLLADDHLEARLARIHRRSLRIAGAGREWTPLEVVELDFPWWRESPRRSAAGGPRA